MDIICALLNRNKSKRLGTKGDVEEILAHPWFSDMDQQAVLDRTIEPPFVPVLEDDMDTKYFDINHADGNLAQTYIPIAK